MSTPLIIVGAGALVSEVAWISREAGFEVLGLITDLPLSQGDSAHGLQVLGGLDEWRQYPNASVVTAIGEPSRKKEVVDKLGDIPSRKFAVVRHPTAVVSNDAKVGAGSVLAPGSIVTTCCRLGSHNYLNFNVTVAHDCVTGDFVTVAPMSAISGNVSIGSQVEIGTGSCIRDGVSITSSVTIGMGSVVVQDVTVPGRYFGNPAKRLPAGI